MASLRLQGLLGPILLEHDPRLAAEVKDLEEFMAVHGMRRKGAVVAKAPAAAQAAAATTSAVSEDKAPPK
ncbi:MAG: hypothetical protein ABI134_34210 [Byssovorax sp.]